MPQLLFLQGTPSELIQWYTYLDAAIIQQHYKNKLRSFQKHSNDYKYKTHSNQQYNLNYKKPDTKIKQSLCPILTIPIKYQQGLNAFRYMSSRQLNKALKSDQPLIADQKLPLTQTPFSNLLCVPRITKSALKFVQTTPKIICLKSQPYQVPRHLIPQKNNSISTLLVDHQAPLALSFVYPTTWSIFSGPCAHISLFFNPHYYPKPQHLLHWDLLSVKKGFIYAFYETDHEPMIKGILLKAKLHFHKQKQRRIKDQLKSNVDAHTQDLSPLNHLQLTENYLKTYLLDHFGTIPNLFYTDIQAKSYTQFLDRFGKLNLPSGPYVGLAKLDHKTNPNFTFFKLNLQGQYAEPFFNPQSNSKLKPFTLNKTLHENILELLTVSEFISFFFQQQLDALAASSSHFDYSSLISLLNHAGLHYAADQFLLFLNSPHKPTNPVACEALPVLESPVHAFIYWLLITQQHYIIKDKQQQLKNTQRLFDKSTHSVSYWLNPEQPQLAKHQSVLWVRTLTPLWNSIYNRNHKNRSLKLYQRLHQWTQFINQIQLEATIGQQHLNGNEWFLKLKLWLSAQFFDSRDFLKSYDQLNQQILHNQTSCTINSLQPLYQQQKPFMGQLIDKLFLKDPAELPHEKLAKLQVFSMGGYTYFQVHLPKNDQTAIHQSIIQKLKELGSFDFWFFSDQLDLIYSSHHTLTAHHREELKSIQQLHQLHEYIHTTDTLSNKNSFAL